MQARCSSSACTSCEGMECVWAFFRPLGDSPGVNYALMGDFAATLWQLFGLGVRLNVTLFLFNVFFPMYPADGAKLLTVGLMSCCGTSARSAATTLIVCSTCCAFLLILYAMYQFKR